MNIRKSGNEEAQCTSLKGIEWQLDNTNENDIELEDVLFSECGSCECDKFKFYQAKKHDNGKTWEYIRRLRMFTRSLEFQVAGFWQKSWRVAN